MLLAHSDRRERESEREKKKKSTKVYSKTRHGKGGGKEILQRSVKNTRERRRLKNYNIEKKKTRFFSLKDVLSETAAVYNNNNNLTNKKETRSEAVPYKVKQKNIKKKRGRNDCAMEK